MEGQPQQFLVRATFSSISRCKSKKKVSIELKILSSMSLKMLTIFKRIIHIFLVKNAANNSEFIELQYFFVNYSKNHRIFPGGFMGKMICRGIPNILLFILYREG